MPPTNREQAVARVREWLDVTRRFTDDCEVDGSWGAGLLMGDIRALVEPLSTPTSTAFSPATPSPSVESAANRESDAIYAPDPEAVYLCPYCNGSARLIDSGSTVDAYKNVCHFTCLVRVRRLAALPNPEPLKDETKAPNGLSGKGLSTPTDAELDRSHA